MSESLDRLKADYRTLPCGHCERQRVQLDGVCEKCWWDNDAGDYACITRPNEYDVDGPKCDRDEGTALSTDKPTIDLNALRMPGESLVNPLEAFLPQGDETLVDEIDELEMLPEHTDEADQDDDDERPVDLFVSATRATAKVRRIMKRQYSDVKTYKRPCHKCSRECLFTQSSQDVLDEAAAEGKRAEVICTVCKDQVTSAEGGTTEGQAKALTEITMKRALRRSKN